MPDLYVVLGEARLFGPWPAERTVNIVPDSNDLGPSGKRGPVAVGRPSRVVLGLIGIAGMAAGAVAVFTRDVEAGPVALLAAGTLFVLIATTGLMPTQLKIGESEARWEREIEQSVERIEGRLPELGAMLNTGGASLQDFLRSEPSNDVGLLTQAGLLVGQLAEDVRFIEDRGGTDKVPADALLEIARWHLSQQDWTQAASYLEMYTRRESQNWEAYFSMGVAYANTRGGPSSDWAALRAYDQALSLTQAGTANHLIPRLYSYRAAIKKRLRLLDSAKVDVDIAKQIAESRFDLIDATYNSACIEALLGNRDAALAQLSELKDLGGIDMVRAHLNDYFESLADEPEFHRLIGQA